MDKLSEKSAKDIEHKLNLFTEFNPNPIIGLNLLGEIIYLNLSARTQFPTITASGVNHLILMVLMRELKKLKPNGKEFIVFSQDINYFDTIYEQQIFVVPNRNTIFIHMTDVTEKKQFEDEIRSANINWQTLAMLSHELRTPLNGIIGMTSLLLNTQLTKEQQEIAETIQRSNDILLTVINQILDFSKHN